ncbi:MAG: sulfatase [Planctomycetota bacterium]|nr:MAG: sulfatase [Planctomycetota bacterium]
MRRLCGKEYLLTFCTVTILSFLYLPQPIAEADHPPNFVILFADDLGYGDLSCYGHPTIHTPNIDRMADEGVRLTQFYSSATVCTPSRASLLTGRYQIRTGLTRVLFPHTKYGMPVEEITLAEALKTKNYATICIGKWHLGHLPRYRPTRHGFDEFFGILIANNFVPPGLGLYRNNEEIEQPVDQGALIESYTEEAIKFITNNKDQPFFLYLPYTQVHIPLQVNEKFAGKSRRGLYGDVAESIDWSMREILRQIGRCGLDEQTLVIFTSDNGPWLSEKENGGSAGLLRGGKFEVWEGGIRMPFIARWPGRIPPGRVSRDVCIMMDIFTTCLTLAGVPLPDDRPIDGKNIMPVLDGIGTRPVEPLFFYTGNILGAVRRGPWKLVLHERSPGRGKKPPANPQPRLFNLLTDPSERFDVARQHPEIVNLLQQDMSNFIEGLQKGK